MSKKIRVIIADDSALMRKKLGEILNSDHEIEVVAIVRNGRELLDVAFHLKPDVITLDVEMPVLNGLEALGYIMSEMPTPCVMISAFTKLGAKETIKALEYGAVDFVAKTSGTISPDIDFLGPEIINKVKLASRVAVQKLKLIWTEKTKDDAKVLKKPQAMTKVFALASSTGGIQALATILPALPADLPAGVLVV
ncbi:MAG TPA: response regulator, partial [bacterium]|nr:response regulator [bacterium]